MAKPRNKKVELKVHDNPTPSTDKKKTRGIKKTIVFAPRNLTQGKLIKAIEDPNNSIVIAMGSAGTGKTYCTAKYAIQQYMAGIIDKIVITRPTVATGENIGFLPGELQDKMEPWLLPIYDVFTEHGGLSKGEIKALILKGDIEIAPFQFMRGRSLKNAIIIADEMQNAEQTQIKMLLTRIGEGSKILITGDLDQTDKDTRHKVNGLKDFVDRFEKYSGDRTGIEIIRFGVEDIVRHPIIEKILDIYE